MRLKGGGRLFRIGNCFESGHGNSGRMNAAIFGFIGVIVGALLTGFKERLFRRWDDEKKAHYLAIRVCTILDVFLYDCADVVQDDGTERGQSGPPLTLLTSGKGVVGGGMQGCHREGHIDP